MSIYETEQNGDILILIPHFGAGEFRYRDFHMASSSMQRDLASKEIKGLLIDLSDAFYFGSEFIGMMIVFSKAVRKHGGKSVICNASSQMLEVLGTMNMSKIVPIVATREEALQTLTV
ncbi:hypothetical protein CA54_25320 [Symmachiella macrocystis]|uniref:STAS domain-containing protein n=1 Tax=Symmachiella macrocystis TaxID=2527985 RepID=A0A5C6BPP8_9PLAN|nr:STAS domain-containing protein [Symmachiella macrocystis]TWU13697.1 hypothetical protein CA54_25320 [Symmachiella macrocystis]